MIKSIITTVGKTFVKLCLSVIMLIALFYLRFYELKPYYTPKRTNLH